MMKKIVFGLFTIALLLFAGCSNNNVGNLENGSKLWLANPASKYCVDDGGKLEIRKNAADGQYGVCIFETFECEEWAYYNGACQDPSLPVEVATTIIDLGNGTIDVLFGDIAERFTYDGDLSKFKVGDNVKIKYIDKEYGKNSLITIEHINIKVSDFDSCVAAGNSVMESYPMQCSHNDKTYVQVIDDKQQMCIFNNGNWIEEFQECEGIGKNSCAEMGGQFNECASACRNNPEAEICTMQCVLVCEFDKVEEIIEESFRGEIIKVENGKDGSTITLKNEDEEIIESVVSIPNLGKESNFDFKSLEVGNQIWVIGKTFEMKGVKHLTAKYANVVYDKYQEKGCKLKGGEYTQMGVAQIYQCNMPAKDAGTECKNSEDCEGMCLSENDKGVCSPYTINFGCIPIIEDGKEVTIYID